MKGGSVRNLEFIVLWCYSLKRNFVSFFLECGGLLKCNCTGCKVRRGKEGVFQDIDVLCTHGVLCGK